MCLCSVPTDKTVDSQAARVGKQPAIPQGEEREDGEHLKLTITVMDSSSCNLLTPPSWSEAVRTARSAVKCRVNFVLSHSNKLHLVAVQRHKGSTSGCLATVWPWRDQTALLPNPLDAEGGAWDGYLCLFQTWLLIVFFLSPQLGLHWKLSKRKCESSNMMEYVSKAILL